MKQLQPEVVVVMTRCLRSGEPFGIRFEKEGERGDTWLATWAFRVSESAGKKEGYDRQQVLGRFSVRGDYPGCPYCEDRGFVSCGSCGRLCCYDERARSTRCSWCGYTAEVGGQIERLRSGGDR